jgi:putative ABC transport system ATP-binding protein
MVERCTRIIRLRDGVVERDEEGAKAERLKKKAA